MRSLILAVLAGSAIAGCSSSAELSPQQRNIQRGIVENRIGVMERHMNNRSLDSLFAMYSESPASKLVWWDGTAAVGPEAVQEAIRSAFNSVQYQSIGAQSPAVEVLSRNAAVSTFGYSLDIVRNDTSRDPFSGRAVIVWTRVGEGDWKIHTQQMSRNP